MQELQTPMETHLHGIRRLFLHPCHYTSVVHRQDGYVYLHDELTGVSVAKSSVSFTEDIDSLAFMDNFNSFCALSRGKHIVVFETDASKWLRHKRMQLPAGQPILATLGISYLEENSLLVCVSNTSIAYLNLQQECIQHTSKLVKGITVSNAHPNVQFHHAQPIDSRKWLLVAHNTLYFLEINYPQHKLGTIIQLQTLIQAVSIDRSIRRKYLSIATLYEVLIIDLKELDRHIHMCNDWIPHENIPHKHIPHKHIPHKHIPYENNLQHWNGLNENTLSSNMNSFRLPQQQTDSLVHCKVSVRFCLSNLSVTNILMYYPGINSSTTDKYQHRLYAVIQGEPKHTNINREGQDCPRDQQRVGNQGEHIINEEHNIINEEHNIINEEHNIINEEHNIINEEHNIINEEHKTIYLDAIPNHLLGRKYLYIYEIEHEGWPKGKLTMASSCFAVQLNCSVSALFLNENYQNRIFCITDTFEVKNILLTSVLSGNNVGQEWVCLGYKFQSLLRNESYQQKMTEFEQKNEQYSSISQCDVNDWTCSLFTKDTVLANRIRRINAGF